MTSEFQQAKDEGRFDIKKIDECQALQEEVIYLNEKVIGFEVDVVLVEGSTNFMILILGYCNVDCSYFILRYWNVEFHLYSISCFILA